MMFWKKTKPAPVRYEWRPLPDITAFELARAVILINAPFYLDVRPHVEALPPEVRRHIVEVAG